ncbi:MAG: NADH-quinone oxidoreductase subunit [Solirubrobacterales bacterium]|nr:NADH-quinone oxidoreductase subunit [Solirubrobacterales bacterium]
MTLHLSFLLWLPAVAGLLGLLLPGRMTARLLALLGSVGALGYAVSAVVDFDRNAPGLQWVTDETWIRTLGIHYKLGIDGVNLFLILLATVLFTASMLWAAGREWERPKLFFFHMGLGHTAVLGALLAQDLALFVVFFDLMLIPFFFLTGIWGPAGTRVAAVTKLVIYTLVGSLLMLTGAIATAVLAASENGTELSFVLTDLQQLRLGEGTQDWIFLFFAAAFLVKMPMFPLHGWMPDGYRNMPLPVLAVFSGVLSKVAAYGFLRIALPLFPDAAVQFQDLMLVIALASILYGSAMAFTTTESRLILGYSSIAQLGFIVLGIFALNEQGAQGAVLQSFNHGLVVAPAFFIVALLSARAGGSEDIRDMGGVATRAPVLTVLFLIVALANLAIPGSANFVGEFYILLGVFEDKVVFAILAFTGVALASVYTLRLFIRAMHNRVGPRVASKDLSVADGLVLVPLVLAILAIAVYPQLPLEKGEKTVAASIAVARDIANPPPPSAAEAPAAPPLEIDPATGQPIDPSGGGQTVDPAAGGAIEIDPNTGQPIDPAAGGAVPAPEEVPAP